MKRLVVIGPEQAAFEDVPEPDCPDDGLVVQALVTAVSAGTEIRVYRAVPVDEAGLFLHERVPFKLPTENGYSMVGRVRQVGRHVSGFAVGDRVFVPAPHKQFAAINALLAVKLPDDIPDEHGVLLNILEVSHIALRRGNPTPGAFVGIVGVGVIGLSGLAYTGAFGLPALAVDGSSKRLGIARAMGAGLALDAHDPQLVDKALEFTGGEGADVVLEAASHWGAIETSLRIARPDGSVVVVARHTDQPQFNPVGHPFFGKGLRIVTSYGHEPPGRRWDRAHSLALTLDLLSRGKLNPAPMITHQEAWHQLPQVYARLAAGDPEMVGVVLRWSD